MSDPTELRRIAAEVIGRVLRGGAYSNILADRATSGFSPSDRSRVKALAFGVLRRVEGLDEALAAASDRPTQSLDPLVLDCLRVSAFEILYGESPPPVLVSAGVDLVRSVSARAAGLANAVLRRVAGQERPKPGGLALPDWLIERLDTEWGVEQSRAFAAASAEEPGRVGRRRNGSAQGYAGIAGAVVLDPGPVPPDVVVQDAASIAVGNAVGAEPGMTVLDMAAAPGGKTLHLLDQVGEGGLVVAMDNHGRRTADGARRVPGAKWLVGDGGAPPLRRASFDRVLLDAPCTGLGTLRRRPEVRLRVDLPDVTRLAPLQRQMLEAALELVDPAGRVVYSVCTVTPEETIQVVADLGFTPAGPPGVIWGQGRLLAPHLTGTDGMFIAVHQS